LPDASGASSGILTDAATRNLDFIDTDICRTQPGAGQAPVVVNRDASAEHPLDTRSRISTFRVKSQSQELHVKLVSTIARYLLGIMFLVFGSNMFLNFIKGQMPTGVAGQFTAALFAAHYFYVVGAIMVISAVLLLADRFVGLGLTLLGPVLFNILTFHLLMNPSGVGAGAFATLLWFLVAWEHRVVFARLFAARLEE
jgi:putative oxidoreductase